MTSLAAMVPAAVRAGAGRGPGPALARGAAPLLRPPRASGSGSERLGRSLRTPRDGASGLCDSTTGRRGQVNTTVAQPTPGKGPGNELRREVEGQRPGSPSRKQARRPLLTSST